MIALKLATQIRKHQIVNVRTQVGLQQPHLLAEEIVISCHRFATSHRQEIRRPDMRYKVAGASRAWIGPWCQALIENEVSLRQHLESV